MNDELQQRGNELNRVNAFLENVLASLQTAVIVVDSDLTVEVWSAQAEELWGVREEEAVGHHLLNLDIGLPIEEVRKPIRATLSGDSAAEHLTQDAVNRRGRAIRVRTTVTPLVDSGSISGAILLIEQEDADVEQ